MRIILALGNTLNNGTARGIMTLICLLMSFVQYVALLIAVNQHYNGLVAYKSFVLSFTFVHCTSFTMSSLALDPYLAFSENLQNTTGHH